MKSGTCKEARKTGVLSRDPVAASLHDITAVILAGGLGTRLRSALPDEPKVLAPVLGRPFLAFLLDQLAAAGIQRAVLLTGYRAERVQEEFGTRYANISLLYSTEPAPLGTAGALRAAAAKLATPTVLLLNGDSCCGVSLGALAEFHRRHHADLSMVLARVNDTSRFGQVKVTRAGRVSEFLEKQKNGRPGWINAGVCLMQRDLIEDIPLNRPVSLEQEILPIWIREKSVYGFLSSGAFLDIGTPESYETARDFFEKLVQAPASRKHERRNEF